MKKLSTHLQYHWWQYLVYAIVVIVLWCTVFHILAQPASHQAIRILFISEYWDTQDLANEIHAHLQKATAQSISAVEIDIETQKSDQLLPLLIAKQYYYDLVIVSDSRMKENIGQGPFGLPIPDQIVANHPEWSYYTEQHEQITRPFAIVLHDETKNNHFSDHYTGSEKCYLFISNQSVNFDQLNGLGQPGHDAAIKTLEYLLEKL